MTDPSPAVTTDGGTEALEPAVQDTGAAVADDNGLSSSDSTSQIQDDNGLSSSDSTSQSQDDNGPDTMLSAVEQALTGSEIEITDAEPDDYGEPSAPSEQSEKPDAQASPDETDTNAIEQPAQDAQAGAEDQDDQAKDALTGDPDEVELSSYKPKTRERIEKLLSERDEAVRVSEVAKPITSYMETNNIPAEDVDVVLQLAGALRHGNFEQFLEGVRPYVALAMQSTGKLLPPDLRQQVESGSVTQEVASELAQRRAAAGWGTMQSEQQVSQQQQQLADFQAQSIRTAVSNWETQTRTSDPDYDVKADMVRRASQAMIQSKGVPGTPEDAVRYAQAAYDEVNKWASRFKPQPKAVNPSPSSVHQPAAQPAPEPSSMLEAAEQALRTMG